MPTGSAPKRDWRPRQDSNLRTRLRRPLLYPLSYEGGGQKVAGDRVARGRRSRLCILAGEGGRPGPVILSQFARYVHGRTLFALQIDDFLTPWLAVFKRQVFNHRWVG